MKTLEKRNLTIFVLVLLTIVVYFYLNNRRDSDESFSKEFVEMLQNNYLYKDSLNNIEFKTNFVKKLEESNDEKDRIKIIRSVFYSLNDRHSKVFDRLSYLNWSDNSSKLGVPHNFYGKRLENGIGYLIVGEYNSGDFERNTIYAEQLQNLIKMIDCKNLKGWIIDLRGNSGGNCWAMIDGIGPLLGNGICGYFDFGNGVKQSWFYKNGAVGLDSVNILNVSNYYNVMNPILPIAVLTDSLTASAGEIVTLALMGKKNTRTFGRTTNGLTTATSPFVLRDSIVVFLTTSYDLDRHGNKYLNGITPQNLGSKSEINYMRMAMLWILNEEY